MSIASGAMLLAALLQAPPPAPAPLRVQTGVAPESVTVGDRFRSVVRLELPPGVEASFPPLRIDDPVAATDTPMVMRSEPNVVSATYPLVAWVAAESLSVVVPVRLSLAGSQPAEYRVSLKLPTVVSVLPSDSTRLEPRPPKPLLALPRAQRPAHLWWALALLLGLAAVAIAWRAWRGRAGREAPRDPLQEALARLDSLLAEPEPLDGSGERFYVEASRVLRRFLGQVEPRWSEDLTTTELVERIDREPFDAPRSAALEELLTEADSAKFAGSRVYPSDAREFAVRTRDWIAAFGAGRAVAEPAERP